MLAAIIIINVFFAVLVLAAIVGSHFWSIWTSHEQPAQQLTSALPRMPSLRIRRRASAIQIASTTEGPARAG